MTNEVEIFFEDVPQQQNVLNVSTSVNDAGDSEVIVGLSAYQIAVNKGFVGTVEEWLESLKGEKGGQGLQGIRGIDGEQGIQGERGLTGDKGDDGLSAYEIAVLNGFAGSALEWLESLEGSNGFNGENGLSAYQIALQYGFEGDESQWIESLTGVNGSDGMSGIDGESAYQVALRNGFVGSEVEWLESLKGTGGTDGGGSGTVERKFPIGYWVNHLNTISNPTLVCLNTNVYMTYFSVPHTIEVSQLCVPYNATSPTRQSRLRLYSLSGNVATAVTDTFVINSIGLNSIIVLNDALIIPSGVYFWAFQTNATSSTTQTIRAVDSTAALPIPRTVPVSTTATMVLTPRAYTSALPNSVDITVTPQSLSTVNSPAIQMFITG